MFLVKKKEVSKEEVVKKAVPEVEKETKTEEVKKEVKEPKEEVKKEEEKHRIIVVKELPVQPVRESVAEDGTILHFLTTEEALSELMN